MSEERYEGKATVVHLVLELELRSLNNLSMDITVAVHCITHRLLVCGCGVWGWCGWCGGGVRSVGSGDDLLAWSSSWLPQPYLAVPQSWVAWVAGV